VQEKCILEPHFAQTGSISRALGSLFGMLGLHGWSTGLSCCMLRVRNYYGNQPEFALHRSDTRTGNHRAPSLPGRVWRSLRRRWSGPVLRAGMYPESVSGTWQASAGRRVNTRIWYKVRMHFDAANPLLPIATLAAGVFLMIAPRIVSFAVAVYLIFVGLFGLNGVYHIIK
jgi:hypothetical protein